MKRITRKKVVIGAIIAFILIAGIVAKFAFRQPQPRAISVRPKAETLGARHLPEASDAMLGVMNQASSTAEVLEFKKSSFYLVSRAFPKSSVKVDELWMVENSSGKLTFMRSFEAADCMKVDFRKDGGYVVLSIDDQCSHRDYQYLRYYVYDTEGRDVFAYEHSENGTDAVMLSDYGYNRTSIALETTPCTETATSKIMATIKGLNLEGVLKPLSSSTVECHGFEMGPGYYDFSFTFGGYNPVFGALTLVLPDGRRALIDVGTNTIIHSKQLYGEPCNGGPSQFTLMTASGTSVLLENVWADPVLHSAAKDNPLACLSKTPARNEIRPTFDLNINFGEGLNYLGTYEFDLKTHRFRKLK